MTSTHLKDATLAEQALVELLVSLASNQRMTIASLVFTSAFSKAVRAVEPFILDKQNALLFEKFRRPEFEMTDAEKLSQAYISEMGDLRKELEMTKQQLASANKKLSDIRRLT